MSNTKEKPVELLNHKVLNAADLAAANRLRELYERQKQADAEELEAMREAMTHKLVHGGEC